MPPVPGIGQIVTLSWLLLAIALFSTGCESEGDRIEARALELNEEGRYGEALEFLESRIDDAEFSDDEIARLERLQDQLSEDFEDFHSGVRNAVSALSDAAIAHFEDEGIFPGGPDTRVESTAEVIELFGLEMSEPHGIRIVYETGPDATTATIRPERIATGEHPSLFGRELGVDDFGDVYSRTFATE